MKCLLVVQEPDYLQVVLELLLEHLRLFLVGAVQLAGLQFVYFEHHDYYVEYLSYQLYGDGDGDADQMRKMNMMMMRKYTKRRWNMMMWMYRMMNKNQMMKKVNNGGGDDDDDLYCGIAPVDEGIHYCLRWSHETDGGRGDVYEMNDDAAV